MLEPMLATGLSPSLTTALKEIQQQIPNLKKEINDGLLKIFSNILMNQQWRHPGMPKVLTVPVNIEYDTNAIVLALETLAKFDVDGSSLIQFVKHCADHFLTSETKEIRLEAVRTCCTLLRQAIEVSWLVS